MIFNLIETYFYFVNKKPKYALLRAMKCYFLVPQFRVELILRIMMTTNRKIIKVCLKNKLLLKYGIEIGLKSRIGKNFHIPHPIGIVIGEKVVIAENCTIYQNVTLGQKNGLYPTLEENVVVFPGAIIFGGITIGKNSIIAGNSVVLTSIPADSIVAGNPCKVIKKKIVSHSL